MSGTLLCTVPTEVTIGFYYFEFEKRNNNFFLLHSTFTFLSYFPIWTWELGLGVRNYLKSDLDKEKEAEPEVSPCLPSVFLSPDLAGTKSLLLSLLPPF
jgi:hypothetical protein